MRVRFLQDYRGHLTGEAFYRQGDEADLDSGPALVAAGRAETVEPPVVAVPDPDPVPAPPPKPASRKR